MFVSRYVCSLPVVRTWTGTGHQKNEILSPQRPTKGLETQIRSHRVTFASKYRLSGMFPNSCFLFASFVQIFLFGASVRKWSDHHRLDPDFKRFLAVDSQAFPSSPTGIWLIPTACQRECQREKARPRAAAHLESSRLPSRHSSPPLARLVKSLSQRRPGSGRGSDPPTRKRERRQDCAGVHLRQLAISLSSTVLLEQMRCDDMQSTFRPTSVLTVCCIHGLFGMNLCIRNRLRAPKKTQRRLVCSISVLCL
jgi:hypothetical protein